MTGLRAIHLTGVAMAAPVAAQTTNGSGDCATFGISTTAALSLFLSKAADISARAEL